MTIYTLKTCDTCRKAVKFLKEHGIPFEEIPIRDHPPGPPLLRLALQSAGGDIRKLFNTSGQDYRLLGIKEKLATLSESDALALLASNGNLIKRPVLISDSLALVGFNESSWSQALP